MPASLTPVNWLGPEMIPNPFPIYARMRAAAPIYPIEPAGLSAVTRYEDVITVLKNPGVFSSAAARPVFEPPWVGHNPLAYSMVVMDPPEHTRNRAAISRAFTPAVVAQMEPRIRQLTQQIMAEWQAAGEVDAIEDVATRLAVTVITQLMGLDPEWQVDFRFWSNVEATLMPVPRDQIYVEAARQAIQEMTEFLQSTIAERRRKPGQDLISLLIQAQQEDQTFSEHELIGFLSLLLLAGFETTVHLIGKSINFLSEHPELCQTLRQHPTDIAKFIEEMLRYDGSAHAIFRTTMQDTELSGTPIKAGTPLVIVLAAANRDPQQFPDPDRFDYNRDNLHKVAFGYGAHFCLGAPLARLETRVLLETLLAGAQGFELAHPAKWTRGMSGHGIAHLFARLRGV